MILGLAAVLALALAGSVSLDPPASRWAEWIGWTVLGLLTYLFITAVIEDGRARRDARRRASFRGPR